MKNKILIIDDEVNIGLLLSKFLTKSGFEVSHTTTGSGALEMLDHEKFDLILCDYRLDDTDGKEILRYVKENHSATGVIIITGYSDIKLAVELIKLGAYDYIVKPLYPDEILNTINKALETQKIFKKYKNANNKNGTVDFFNQPQYINGKSKASLNLLTQINLIAPNKLQYYFNRKKWHRKRMCC